MAFSQVIDRKLSTEEDPSVFISTLASFTEEAERVIQFLDESTEARIRVLEG